MTVIATRGGKYAGTPVDTQTGLVETFMGFIGLTQVEFVYAEGLAMGPEAAEAAKADARARINELAIRAA